MYKKGFTLMELLLVLAIVGGLSAVTLSAFAESQAQIRDGKRITELVDVTYALYLHAKERGTYPAHLEALLSNSYITTIPVDPKTGKRLTYEVARDGSRYYIGTNLESRRAGFLQFDSDSGRVGFFGDDLTGCSQEFGYYCFDISKPLP